MADVHVYIDGFNLYYGALKRTPYKWLDLAKLCQHMLPGDHIRHIGYYTGEGQCTPPQPLGPDRSTDLSARVEDNSSSYDHLRTLLDALRFHGAEWREPDETRMG